MLWLEQRTQTQTGAVKKQQQQNTHEEEKKGVSTALGKSRQASNPGSNPGVGRVEKTKDQKLWSRCIVPFFKNKTKKKTTFACCFFQVARVVGASLSQLQIELEKLSSQWSHSSSHCHFNLSNMLGSINEKLKLCFLSFALVLKHHIIACVRAYVPAIYHQRRMDTWVALPWAIDKTYTENSPALKSGFTGFVFLKTAVRKSIRGPQLAFPS